MKNIQGFMVYNPLRVLKQPQIIKLIWLLKNKERMTKSDFFGSILGTKNGKNKIFSELKNQKIIEETIEEGVEIVYFSNTGGAISDCLLLIHDLLAGSASTDSIIHSPVGAWDYRIVHPHMMRTLDKLLSEIEPLQKKEKEEGFPRRVFTNIWNNFYTLHEYVWISFEKLSIQHMVNGTPPDSDELHLRMKIFVTSLYILTLSFFETPVCDNIKIKMCGPKLSAYMEECEKNQRNLSITTVLRNMCQDKTIPKPLFKDLSNAFILRNDLVHRMDVADSSKELKIGSIKIPQVKGQPHDLLAPEYLDLLCEIIIPMNEVLTIIDTIMDKN